MKQRKEWKLGEKEPVKFLTKKERRKKLREQREKKREKFG